MQVLKVGLFLVLGAAAACGGGSDGDGDGDGDGGDDDDSGGSSSSGGSSGNGGSSSGKGGASSGGASSGGASSGGTTGLGGTTGVGGTSGGSVCLFNVPECEDFFGCVFDAACAQAGAQQDACIAQFKQVFQTSACYPAGTDLATACDMAKQDPSLAMTYPQCVN